MTTESRPRFVALALLFLCLIPATARAEQTVRIGFGPSLTSSLDIIADSQGFFAREGLRAELREFTRGSKAIEALARGEIDLSSSTAFAVVAHSFVSTGLRVVASVAIAGNDNLVVARRDRGIFGIGDLRGKRVGAMKGGMSQYVLDLQLLQAGLTIGDLTVVFDEPPALVSRLVAGDLDAANLFGAWVEQAQAGLVGNAALFADESLVRVTTFVAAMESRIRRDPALFAGVLRSYIRAEEFIRTNPERALEIVAERFKLDREASRKLWKPNLFHVALEQSVMSDLDNMARWIIDTGTVQAKSIPNTLGLIWFPTLEEIDPKRVTIVH